MSEEKQGIKEVKELMMAVNALAVELIKVFKDGIQASDAAALIGVISGNPELQAKLMAAWSGIGSVPAEVKDLDVAEGIELVVMQAQQIPAILDALKKSV